MGILDYDLFPNEKLVSDKPFIEKRVPEYPVWMKQPAPGETFDKAILKPLDMTNARWPNIVFPLLLVLAFAVMALI